MRIKKLMTVAILSASMAMSSMSVCAAEPLSDSLLENTEEEKTEDTRENEVVEEQKTEDTEVEEEKISEDVETVEESESDVLEYADVDEEVAVQAEDGIPTEFSWDEKGQLSFKHNLPQANTYNQQYYIQVRNNDTGAVVCYSTGFYNQTTDKFTMNFRSGKSYDFENHKTVVGNTGFNESGKYQCRFKVREGAYESQPDFNTGKISEWSSEYTFTKASTTLDKPTNLHWTSDGVLTWDAVTGANGYRVKISSDGDFDKVVFDATSINLYTELAGKSDVKVVVQAIKNDYLEAVDSDYSEEITYQLSEVIETDKKPTDLTWDVSQPGYINFKHNLIWNDGYEQEYYLQIRKDNDDSSIIQQIVTITGENDYFNVAPTPSKNYNFKEHKTVSSAGAFFSESGKYQYRLKVKETEDEQTDFSTGIVSDWSPEFEYNKPSVSLSVPTNLHWENETVLTWDSVNNADGYRTDIYSANDGTVISYPVYGTSIDLKAYFTDVNGTYVVAVQAVKKTVGQCLDSDYSEEITYQPTTTPDPNPTPDPDPNPTPDPDPTPTPTPDPTPTPNPQPGDNSGSSNAGDSSVTSNGGSTAPAATSVVKAQTVPSTANAKGWDGVAGEINTTIANTAAGIVPQAIVSVNMNRASEIPVAVLQQMAGKDVTVSFAAANNVIVNISGTSLDGTVTGAAGIASALDKEKNTLVQIRNAAVDMTKTITIFQKAKEGTTEATLYFIDADGTLIPFRKSVVYANGYVAFEVPFVNANYVVK